MRLSLAKHSRLSRGSQKGEHSVEKRLGFLDLRRMATGLDHDQSRARNGLLVQRTAIERDNGVLAAPDNQGGRLYLGHEDRQLGVIHVWLPGEQGRHLAVPGGHLALVEGGFAAI